ncbi:MAG: VWA domain-containing protein [Acidobacteriota bacterium]
MKSMIRYARQRHKQAFFIALLSLVVFHPAESIAQSSIRVESFTLKPGGQVRIENARGGITVEVWEGHKVRITAEKTNGTPIERTDLVLMAAQNTVLAQCRQGARMGRIDLVVYVPQNSHLQVVGGAWPVEVSGSLASAVIENTSGSINYRVPKTDNAQVSMHSTRGLVRSSIPLQISQRAGSRGIDGRLGNGGAQIFLRSHSGNITLSAADRSATAAIADALPSRDAAADTDAKTDRQAANPSGPRSYKAPAQTQSAADQAKDDSDPNSIATPPSQRSTAGGDWASIGGHSKNEDNKQSDKIGPLNRSRDRQQTDDSSLGMRVRIIPSNQPLNSRPVDNQTQSKADDPQSQQSRKPDPIYDDPPDPKTNTRKSDKRDDAPVDTAASDSRPVTPPVLKRRNDADPQPEGPPPSPSESYAKKDPDADKVDDEEAIKLNSSLVNLTVSATNRSGAAVANLSKENFQVFENGQPQQIEFFAPSTAPFNLVLLLDLSGSMKDKIELVKSAALKFIDAVGKQDKIAVVAFTDQVTVISQLTSNRDLLRSRIKAIKNFDGATKFYEAMWFALVDSLRGTRGQRNAIVVVSDGVDSSIDRWQPLETRVTFERLARRLEESDVLVFPIYIDTEYEEAMRGNSVSENYAIARLQLERMAELTGGVAYQAEQVSDLAGVYKQVAAALRTIYTVGYYPVNAERDGTYRRVQVRVDRGEVAVRTRKGYWAK